MARVGLLHPGAMGSSLASALVGKDISVAWASDGRSPASKGRAESAGLTDVETVESMARQCEIIISVCPPGVALDIAHVVADSGFSGVYLDANAVSPETARSIGSVLQTAGATFVDGGIVGLPASPDGLTVLYLSGDDQAVATCSGLFADSAVTTHRVGRAAGAASATKMAFAAWTKGTSALLLAIRALAEHEGVVEGLEHAWSNFTPDLPDRLVFVAGAVGPKAWRFEAEMAQIAESFEAAGLPGGFHAAAADVYERLASLRDQDQISLDDVMKLVSDAGD